MVRNLLKNVAYNVTIQLNYPQSTGLKPPFTASMNFIINSSASNKTFNLRIYPVSGNSLEYTIGNIVSTLTASGPSGNIYGVWNFTTSVTQISNTSNSTRSTTSNVRIFPKGTTLPANFIYSFPAHDYNGLIQSSPSYSSNTFVIGESHLPFIADNVIAKGGDDQYYVGNWSWDGSNETNIRSIKTAVLPLVGTCTASPQNGAPAFLNLTITKTTLNSIEISTGSEPCNSISTNYDISTGSNTIYGTWSMSGSIFEYSSPHSTTQLPYDDAEPKFTGVYDGYYYEGVQLQNRTRVYLSLNILPEISVPSLTESSNPVPVNSTITFTAKPHGGKSPYSYSFYIYNSSTNALVKESGRTSNSIYAYAPPSTGGYYAKVIVTDSLGYSKNSTKTYFSVFSKAVQYSCPSGNSHLTIFSNSVTLAKGPDTGNTWANATPTYSGNTRWTASIPGATWIWDNYTVSNPAENQTVQFKRPFSIPGTVKDAILTIATDNDGKFSINSKSDASWATSDMSYEKAVSFNVSNVIASGSNLVLFNVTNIGIAGSNPQSNPAGLLYNLTICYAPATFNNSDVHVSIPNSEIDQGQSETITTIASGGVTPYKSYVWTLNGNPTGTNSPSLTFNGNASTLGNDIITVTVTDSVDQKGTGTGKVQVNALPSFGTPGITIPDSTINIGSSETVTANEIGGTAPFTYAWTENGKPVSGDTSNQLTFSAKVAGANIIGVSVTDANKKSASATGTITVVNGISLGMPQLTVPNSILEVGQTETITANVLGGVLPYRSFVWMDNGNIIHANSQSITFIGAANNLGLNNLQVTVTDSSGKTATGTGSVNVINAAEITLTPATSSVTSGGSITYTVTVSGGIGPFNIELYNITGSKPQGSNVTITSPGGSNTITITAGPTGTFTYNAIATDTATNTLFNSTKAVLTVNSAGCTSNCGGGGGGGGGGGNFVPTVKTSGNCTTISNFSQDNYESFNLKGHAFDVTLNSISPTQVDITINGYTYTLDTNTKTKLTGMANYSVDLESISYLPIVHTVTVEICYIGTNTGQKQSSGPEGSMIVSLTTNKTISVQNGPVLLTGSITNGTTGPYKYNFIVTNSTGKIVFNKTNTNSKTTNSTIFTPKVPGIYTAAVHITTDGTTGNSNPKSLTVSALQESTTVATTIATTTIKPAAPPASVSSWLILLIIILIIIVLLLLYYYMRRQQKKGKK